MGYGRSPLGVTPLLAVVGGGTTTAANTLNAVNNAVSYRFLAPDTRDVKGVYVNWSTITSPGTVRVRIETDDGSGKPSGTLYDASATVDVTPTLGWQLCQFAALPTAGLTAGALYHIVLITTVAGTAQSLRRSWGPAGGAYPLNALSAADGSTRINLTENTSSVPVATVVFEDNAEETCGFAPFATSSNFTVYGTRAAGLKLTVPTGVTLSVVGVVWELPTRSGTPDDLRCRILNSSNVLVSGASVTLPKGGLLSASGRRLIFRFPAAVDLPAGTYRIIFDQAGNTSTSGNNWQLYSAVHRTSALMPSYLQLTTTTDVTAGTPTWVDTNTDLPTIGLQLNDVSGSGGGGSYAGAGDVRSGVDRGDGTLGTLTLPAVGHVKSGVQFGAAGTEYTGTRATPAVGNVRSGTGYGADGTELTGTLELPAEADVLLDVQYGAGGTEFAGELVTSGGGGMTLSQLQTELNTRGLTTAWAAAVPANVTQIAGEAAVLDPDLTVDGIAAAAAAAVTEEHGDGSYLRNTEPDNTGIGNAASAATAAASSAASAATAAGTAATQATAAASAAGTAATEAAGANTKAGELQTEVAKIPRQGETFQYRNVGSDATEVVAIEAEP